MNLIKCKINDCIKIYNETCGISNLTIYDVSGINRDKEFFEPSKQVGADTSKYKTVPPGYFACNLMHVGRDKLLPISLNHTNKVKYVSPAYTVFSIRNDAKLIKEYFFMMLKSDEKDRFFWFNTDASIREGMSWEDFCNINIQIPPIKIQEKYVKIYNAMLKNQQLYEVGLEDLKLVCFSTIEHFKTKYPLKKIGDYINPFNKKNVDKKITLEQGINIDKEFITPQRSNSNLQGRKIVKTGMIAYCTQLNNENVAIAYREGEDCIVSSVYDVFEISKKESLIAEYLMLWLIRPEFGRFVYWASEGSAYEFLNYENLSDYYIPIPPLVVQQSISNIYKIYKKRKELNDKLKKQINDICPILIKGSVEEVESHMEV